MSQGMNVCHFIGHLGKNSVLRHTQGGQAVLSFRVACGDRYRNSEGEWVEHVEWVNAVIYGKRAEGLASSEMLLKGARVQFSGQLRQRTYDTQSGETRYVTEIRVRDFIPLGSPQGTQIRDEVPEEDAGDDYEG